MAKACEKAQDCDRGIEVQTSSEANRDQKSQQFARRDCQHIEHQKSGNLNTKFTNVLRTEEKPRQNRKGRSCRPTLNQDLPEKSELKRGLDLEAPSLKKWLGNVLRILVAPCPLA